MPKDEEDAQMRAQLALMELEQVEVDETGQIVDKQYEAHRLGVAGLTWRQIAKRLGYNNEAAAHRAVTTYLQSAAVLLSNQKKEEALNLSLTRLETLMHQHWQSALLGDDKAAGVVLKCITEINKILGLYEVKESSTVERFVVIQREAGSYEEQLKQIALAKQEPIALGSSSESITEENGS